MKRLLIAGLAGLALNAAQASEAFDYGTALVESYKLFIHATDHNYRAETASKPRGRIFRELDSSFAARRDEIHRAHELIAPFGESKDENIAGGASMLAAVYDMFERHAAAVQRTASKIAADPKVVKSTARGLKEEDLKALDMDDDGWKVHDKATEVVLYGLLQERDEAAAANPETAEDVSKMSLAELVALKKKFKDTFGDTQACYDEKQAAHAQRGPSLLWKTLTQEMKTTEP